MIQHNRSANQGQGSSISENGAIVDKHKCIKCGADQELKEVGFFPKSILVASYIFGALILIGYFGLIMLGISSAPTGAGGGKFIVFLPIIIFFLILKVRKNVIKKVWYCTICDE